MRIYQAGEIILAALKKNENIRLGVSFFFLIVSFVIDSFFC